MNDVYSGKTVRPLKSAIEVVSAKAIVAMEIFFSKIGRPLTYEELRKRVVLGKNVSGRWDLTNWSKKSSNIYLSHTV